METQIYSGPCPQNGPDDVMSSKQYSDIKVGSSPITDRAQLSSQTRASWLKWLRKSWAFYLSQLLCILWLAPIALLLWLNFSQQVIGPSAWCPNKAACSSHAWDIDAFVRAQELDKQDRNLLGALQVVAKGLEIWFGGIAAALVYDLTMILGRMKGGLPIGFIFTHLKFVDVLNLLNPQLWNSASGSRGTIRTQGKHTAMLFVFAIFVSFLTCLANLMGPAVAILVLPTLSWVETPRVPTQVFHNLPLESAPQGDGALDGCDASALDAGNFSCTLDRYGTDLDDFAVSALHGRETNMFDSGKSKESAVLMMVNWTNAGEELWVPNRQVLSLMTSDMLQYVLPDEYGRPPTPVNDSLSLKMNREGPSVGILQGYLAGNVSVTNVTAEKQIRCLNGLRNFETGSSYTKCYRVGRGFNATNKMSNFYLRNNETGKQTNVEVFYSDRITYFNDTTDFGSGIKHCLNGKVADTCNWDRIFATPTPDDLSFGNGYRNLPGDMTVVSYPVTPDLDLSGNGIINEDARRIYCEHSASYDFPTYSMDASLATNPVNAVILTNLRNDTGSPLAVDPAWFLAAWSANRNGTSRAKLSQSITDFLPSAWTTMTENPVAETQTDPSGTFTTRTHYAFLLLHFYSVAQSVSMVKYGYDNVTTNNSPLISPDTRVLYKYALRHVWAYGLDSRSSKFAVVMAVWGSACTILRLFVGFLYPDRREAHTPVDFLTAALKHQYRGELEELAGDGERKVSDERKRRKRKKNIARVRYRIEEDKEGTVKFVQPN